MRVRYRDGGTHVRAAARMCKVGFSPLAVWGETMADRFPSFDLTGQVVLVTAAARGLGRACALAMAHAGADVALGLRRKESGADLVKEIEAMGRRALPLQMDMERLNEIRSA